ncbi:MAG: hypothetical protein JRI23_15250 [Deltaproteobacteria bacterium]|jgi:hypothetical protein|nr:hypothetical protein [Deltaproteobacteria bacterium]MBW2533105.1 hypothetical protein [Deltaproteobacteria bacterium]
MELPAGLTSARVELPAESYVTLGVVGPKDALIRWHLEAPPGVTAPRAHESLDEDGKLPAFLSFITGAEPSHVVVVVEVGAPVSLWRVSADPNDLAAPSPRELRLGRAEPRPMIGLPPPLEPRDGYLLKPPARYLFFRIDIAVALRHALRQTRVRFRRNPIVVGDGSQWDGFGPGMDHEKSRHIGHRGGTEVDIGLPSNDDSPSTIVRRCDGVLIEKDELVCSPGTVRRLDAYRLAYFLGLLLDGPTPNGIYMPDRRPGPIAPVLSILTDQAYVDEIRKAAERLRKRRWIHDDGYGALVEEGLLRPSSWHTDHVHIRFAGERGRPLIP